MFEFPGYNCLPTKTSLIELEMIFRLIVKDISKLFTKFGMDYEKVFIYQSIDILLELVRKITAYYYKEDDILMTNTK